MKNLLKIVLFTIVCLVACNSEPRPLTHSETLFANFYIRYLQPEKQVKAEANFLKGDSLKTAKPLLIDGGVAFLSSGMSNRTLPNGAIRYTYENFLDYPSEFTFKFKNPSGDAQKKIVKLDPLSPISAKGSISQSKGGILILEKDTLSNGESLVVLISDAEGHTVSFVVESESGSSEFEIPAKKLAKLSSGKINLYVVRKRVEEVNEPGYSFTSTIEYYSDNHEFELVD
ncbi:MAG: hypothetical protein NXI23_22840 [Bacteroidetes bacterium]|nr:hypothetical protein [Bacteroidota bacterium]